MGGGGEEFSSSMNFFSLTFPLNEYICFCQEYFFFFDVTAN